MDTINPKVRAMEYAVRGAIVTRAGELETQLKKDPASLPFDKIVMCNIGNPQSVGQKPITFYRQVLALTDYPQLMDAPEAGKLFPSDVISTAKHILENMKGGTGAYSESKGVAALRQMVADGIEARDGGHKCHVEDLWLTDGASVACHYIMKTLIRDGNDAVMVPIPQYPLYSASLALYGGTLVPYYLDEDKEWGLDVADLKVQLDKARAAGKEVRALCVINPGNPTGNALNVDNQKEIVQFCKDEGVLLIADEVYQERMSTRRAGRSRPSRRLSATWASTSPWSPCSQRLRASTGSAGGAGGTWRCAASTLTSRLSCTSSHPSGCAPTSTARSSWAS